MITPDPTNANGATAPHDEMSAFLEALAAGPTVDGSSVDGADELDAQFVATAAEILRAPGGTLEVVLSTPQSRSTHEITLARAGLLRRSRGTTAQEDLAVHPTSVLPGILLRLAAIAPVEPLPPEVGLDLPTETVQALFDADLETRTAAWTALTEAGTALPAADDAQLEQAPPRAARLVRHRPEGSRSAIVVLLRGRYLVADGTEGPALRGTSPTGATRSLMAALLQS